MRSSPLWLTQEIMSLGYLTHRQKTNIKTLTLNNLWDLRKISKHLKERLQKIQDASTSAVDCTLNVSFVMIKLQSNFNCLPEGIGNKLYLQERSNNELFFCGWISFACASMPLLFFSYQVSRNYQEGWNIISMIWISSCQGQVCSFTKSAEMDENRSYNHTHRNKW